MEEQERIETVANLLRDMTEEELEQVFQKAQLTLGWMRLKKSRIIPLTEGGEEGSDQWWQYADELHLPSLGVDGSLAAVINYDRKQKLWFTEAPEGYVAFDDLYAAMEYSEARATLEGWTVRFCGIQEEEDEEGQLDADELTDETEDLEEADPRLQFILRSQEP